MQLPTEVVEKIMHSYVTRFGEPNCLQRVQSERSIFRVVPSLPVNLPLVCSLWQETFTKVRAPLKLRNVSVKRESPLLLHDLAFELKDSLCTNVL